MPIINKAKFPLFGLLLLLLYPLSGLQAQDNLQTWSETLAQKSGSLTINYYPIQGYIIQEDKGFQGLEYELLKAFQDFLEEYYDVRISYIFNQKNSFGELYQSARSGKEGDFFIASFSITEERKKEVSFSPSYMPDISVMITSLNLPIVKDTTEFVEKFQGVQALVVAETVLESHFEKIQKNYLPTLEKIYIKNPRERWDMMSNQDNMMTFMQLDTYFKGTQQGYYLKRQNIFKFNGLGRAIVLPRGSDWEEPLNAFFKQKNTRQIIENLIRKHFGKDTQELFVKAGGSQSGLNQSEIDILTRERDLNQRKVIAQDVALERRNLLIIFASIFMLLLVAMGFVIYSRYRLQKKTQQLLLEKNQEIITQNEELIQQSEEISSQRDAIERRNKLLSRKDQEISKSLNTALFIQQAIMPAKEVLDNYFKEYFLMYRPRDVVSGDFYWAKPYENELFIVVGDCTGHGVPGAFISLISIMLLQEIIFTRNIHDPGEILNCLHQSIKKTLCQEEKRDNNGMDAIICRVKAQSDQAQIHYASAKRPLYYKTQADHNIQKIKGTRKSIGGLQNESIRFETRELELHKGSMVYLFTDGLVDQNNALRKKLGEPQLLSQLNQIFSQAAPEQRHQLNELLDQHMSETTQRDDITGLGFRI